MRINIWDLILFVASRNLNPFIKTPSDLCRHDL